MYAAWLKQYSALHEQLKPYVIQYDDGFSGVDPTGLAPAQLLELYGTLQSVGYAKGWL